MCILFYRILYVFEHLTNISLIVKLFTLRISLSHLFVVLYSSFTHSLILSFFASLFYFAVRARKVILHENVRTIKA